MKLQIWDDFSRQLLKINQDFNKRVISDFRTALRPEHLSVVCLLVSLFFCLFVCLLGWLVCLQSKQLKTPTVRIARDANLVAKANTGMSFILSCLIISVNDPLIY